MKNLKVYNKNKRLAALATAGILAVSSSIGFSGCSKKPEKVDESMTTITELFADDTQLDEAIENGEAAYNGEPITEVADKLESYIYVVSKAEKLSHAFTKEEIGIIKDKIGFSVPKEEIDKILSSKEEVDLMYDYANNKADIYENESADVSKIKKDYANLALSEAYSIAKPYVDKNAKNICNDLLDYTTRASIAEGVNIKDGNINEVKYPWGGGIDSSSSDIIATINNKTYVIDSTDPGIGETVNEIFNYNSEIYEDKDFTYDYYLEIINLAKKTTMLATKLNEGGRFTSDKLVNARDFESAEYELEKRRSKK